MTGPRPYRIVVAIDFSDITDVVLESALDAASRHERPEIHVVNVLVPPRGLFRDRTTDYSGELEEIEKALSKTIGEKLADFGHPPDRLGSWRVAVHARVGKAAEEVCFLAWEAEADLLVLGRHGDVRGRRFFIGSVPERVLRLATCPVLVVQPVDYRSEQLELGEGVEPCAECAAVRRDSGGQQWFCEEHRDRKLSRASYLSPSSPGMPIGHGPMW